MITKFYKYRLYHRKYWDYIETSGKDEIFILMKLHDMGVNINGDFVEITKKEYTEDSDPIQKWSEKFCMMPFYEPAKLSVKPNKK